MKRRIRYRRSALRIETYFQQIRDTIDACPVIQSSRISFDKRSTHEGFIRGELYFADDSVLHLREFVDVESNLDRLTYVYQYMDTSHRLVFRYDNTGHHRKLNLPTYPHHKHQGSVKSKGWCDGASPTTSPHFTSNETSFNAQMMSSGSRPFSPKRVSWRRRRRFLPGCLIQSAAAPAKVSCISSFKPMRYRFDKFCTRMATSLIASAPPP